MPLNSWPMTILIGVLTIVVVLAGCSRDSSTPVPSEDSSPVDGAGSPTRESAGSTDPSEELNVVVISTDLSAGSNRLVFGLLEPDNSQVTEPAADVVLSHQGLDPVPDVTAKATFRQWPFGDQGVYTAQVQLPQAGLWVLEAQIFEGGESTKSGAGVVQVKEEPSTPAIGFPAPASENKTAGAVDDLAEITTANPPDLYHLTIAEALVTDMPLVVVFATPAFCVTATCGPQVEVVGELKQAYEGRANFIHVEIFDNPSEIQGEPERATISPVVTEWGLLSEPWTFVVGRDSLIAAKFEGFTTYSELEEGLAQTLE